jgi:hypothetical protein
VDTGEARRPPKIDRLAGNNLTPIEKAYRLERMPQSHDYPFLRAHQPRDSSSVATFGQAHSTTLPRNIQFGLSFTSDLVALVANAVV